MDFITNIAAKFFGNKSRNQDLYAGNRSDRCKEELNAADSEPTSLSNDAIACTSDSGIESKEKACSLSRRAKRSR